MCASVDDANGLVILYIHMYCILAVLCRPFRIEAIKKHMSFLFIRLLKLSRSFWRASGESFALYPCLRLLHLRPEHLFEEYHEQPSTAATDLY
jgi:hypothetical protein